MEIIGTTIFMLAALTGDWLVIGLTLSVLIKMFGGVYNPAVIIGKCLLGKKSWLEGGKYIGKEILGVIIAVIIYLGLKRLI
jgi:glycerol uptake facilitator-like aquaporin